MAAPVSASTLIAVSKSLEDYLSIGLKNIALPRGLTSEITGPRSSGRTGLLLATLAAASSRGECCAVVDTCDRFHPASAAAAGVDLDGLVWIRCAGDAGKAFQVADWILHGGGFSVVVLDLSDLSARVRNRIPTSYWFRFRRAIQNTPTILLVCAEQAEARSTASRWIECGRAVPVWSGRKPARLLAGFSTRVTIRKPAPPETFTLDSEAF